MFDITKNHLIGLPGNITTEQTCENATVADKNGVKTNHFQYEQVMLSLTPHHSVCYSNNFANSGCGIF